MESGQPTTATGQKLFFIHLNTNLTLIEECSLIQIATPVPPQMWHRTTSVLLHVPQGKPGSNFLQPQILNVGGPRFTAQPLILWFPLP